MSTPANARCERVRLETESVKVFTFRLDGSSTNLAQAIQPGRYVAIEYPDCSGERRKRLYSVIRKDAPDLFEIAVKRTGAKGVSDRLHDSIEEGSTISVGYADGAITVASIRSCKQAALMAGGIGITLPIALIRELASLAIEGYAVPQVTIYLCCKKISDIAFLHELLELDLTTDWLSLRIFVTQGHIKGTSMHFSAGRPALEDLATIPEPEVIVICGSHDYVSQFGKTLRQLHPSSKLLMEAFTPSATMPGAINAADNEQSIGAARLIIAGEDQSIDADINKTLLENLQEADIPIKSQCRSGICGSCRLKIVSGEVRRELDFCLDERDKQSGYALACRTFPVRGPIILSLHADC